MELQYGLMYRHFGKIQYYPIREGEKEAKKNEVGKEGGEDILIGEGKGDLDEEEMRIWKRR